MKQSLGCVALFAGLLVFAGCVTTTPEAGIATAPMHAAKSYPPVTHEQITDKNGHQVAQALEDEINREQQQNMLNPTSR